MNRIFMAFLLSMFGIMLGYGWQYYHHGLAVSLLRQEIQANQEKIDTMEKDIAALNREIEYEQIAQRIIVCESQGKHNAKGDGGKSYGPAQFKRKTFNWMKTLAGRPELAWKNSEHQIWLLKWALRNGYGNHWACYDKV